MYGQRPITHSPALRPQNESPAPILFKIHHGIIVIEVPSNLLLERTFVRPYPDIHKRFVVAERIRINVPRDVGEILWCQCFTKKFTHEPRSIIHLRGCSPEFKELVDMLLLWFDPPVNQYDDHTNLRL